MSANPEIRAEHLRLELDAGGPAFLFHWFWLRHNCPCCVHPATGERTLDARTVALDLEPRALDWDGTTLRIAWTDHESRYDAAWLRTHAYGTDADVPDPPFARLSDIVIDRSDDTADPALARRALDRVIERGAVIVRGWGLDTEVIIEAFAALGLDVRGTHFGRIEDLRTDNTTNQNTDQLGYTDAPVELHTDQPFIDAPPRFQLLQAIRQADEGGESIVADARIALEYLRKVDEASWRLLVSTPVRFHRRQKAFESIVDTPLFTTDGYGVLRQVRHSYFTFAPHRLPFAEMEAFYRAYQRFQRIVHDSRHHLALPARSGRRALLRQSPRPARPDRLSGGTLGAGRLLRPAAVAREHTRVDRDG
jgi:gamma-butyrobetaine dioxygenase/trimethyllysine dioxygenase